MFFHPGGKTESQSPNGLKSIFQHFSPDFTRLRVGIGRPPEGETPTHHVLADFSSEERSTLRLQITRSADALETTIESGVQYAMNETNQRRKHRQESANGPEEERG